MPYYGYKRGRLSEGERLIEGVGGVGGGDVYNSNVKLKLIAFRSRK